MSDGRFVGRERELERLGVELERERPSLVVVYGRRRVGKSRLLAEATVESSGRSTVYYQATEVTSSRNLELFKGEVERAMPEQASGAVWEGLGGWEAVLEFVVERASGAAGGGENGLTVVLDEFPYICEAEEALPSIVQKVFDRAVASSAAVNLVLCGSKISFMEGMLAEESPLRGRPTCELDLQPLTYREAAGFFRHWTPVDRLRAFGVFGGMPYYLQLTDERASFRSNLKEVILETGAPLSHEVTNVLRSELSAPTRYATILEAIANGCTTTGEIVGRVTDIDNGSQLSPYIQRLEALRLVRITRSLDAAPKARNRRYEIADPFVSFWFRFCAPNSSALTTGHADGVFENAIAPAFDEYMGRIFDQICRQFVRHYADEIFPTAAREVGKIWGADFDIDVAGELVDGAAVVGECKWWEDPVGENVYDDLRLSAQKTSYVEGEDEPHYVLFAKRGFTDALVGKAERSERLSLVGAKELGG